MHYISYYIFLNIIILSIN